MDLFVLMSYLRLGNMLLVSWRLMGDRGPRNRGSYLITYAPSESEDYLFTVPGYQLFQLSQRRIQVSKNEKNHCHEEHSWMLCFNEVHSDHSYHLNVINR